MAKVIFKDQVFGENNIKIFNGTQTEWNGLSVAEKTQYTYCNFTDDNISSSDKYSTEEIKTNKVWINGKSIYRRVLVVQTAFDLGTDWINIVPYCGNPTLNLDTLVYGMNTVENGAYIKKSGVNSIILARQGSAISVPVGSAFIIEYTKTTD